WDAARRAIAYTVARQRPDGSWPYGEAPGLEWVDGFHTAYVLDALADYVGRVEDPPARAALERGTAFYVERLIDPDGAARPPPAARPPAPGSPPRPPRAPAGGVPEGPLATMQRREGRSASQQPRRYRNSIPYVRWSDGHMLLALADYLARDAC